MQGVGSPSATIIFTILKKCKALTALLLTLLEQCKALAVLQQPPFYPSEELQALEVLLHTLLQQCKAVGSPSANAAFWPSKEVQGVGSSFAIAAFTLSKRKCNVLAILLHTLLQQGKLLAVHLQPPFLPSK